jgi:hypothetical protein
MNEEKFNVALEKANELTKLQFTEKDNFDFNGYFDAIHEISRKNNFIKNEEADNIIKDYAPMIIGEEAIASIVEKKDRILNYLRMYDANTENVKSMSDHDLDKIYAISNYLVNSYINHLNEILFIFNFTNEEFKFADRLLTKTIKYNADDVFNYVDFYESFWIKAKEEFDANKGKTEFSFRMNIKNILIFHHLIKNYTVAGSGNEFLHFRNILYRIATCNKLFNAYNIVTDRIKEDCKIWGASLDEVTTSRKIEQLDAEDAKPKIKEIEATEVQ